MTSYQDKSELRQRVLVLQKSISEAPDDVVCQVARLASIATEQNVEGSSTIHSIWNNGFQNKPFFQFKNKR